MTTTPAELRALADGVEASQCRSDKLNFEIATWCYENGAVAGVDYVPQMWVLRNGGDFTSSLDAAMTLKPDDHYWSLVMKGDETGGFTACCQREGQMVWHDAATPALALCAAFLRARALIMEQENDG